MYPFTSHPKFTSVRAEPAGPICNGSRPKTAAGVSFSLRLVLAGTLFAVELIPVSLWNPGHAGPAATGQFWDLGLSKYLAGLLCLYSLFVKLSRRSLVKELDAALREIPVGLRFLNAQIPAYLLVFWLSGMLHDPDSPWRMGISLKTIAVARLLAGFAAIFLGLCVAIPPRLQMALLRRTYGLGLLAALAMGCVFLPTSWNDMVWNASANMTFHLVAIVLSAVTRDVVSNPAESVIGTGHFLVKVGVACSGVEGAQLMLAFSLTYLAAFRKECRFPQALLLVPAGVVVLYLANTVRIAALILIGSAGAPGIAVAGFHSEAGWLAFLAVALAFCLCARHVPGLRAAGPGLVKTTPERTQNPTLWFLLPLLTIVLCRVLATAVTGEPQWMYMAAPPLAGLIVWLRRKDWAASWMPGWRGAGTGVLVFAAWMAFDYARGSKSDAAPAILSGGARIIAFLWLALRSISAVVTTPIAEELAFRGFGMRRAMSRDFETVPLRSVSWQGILVSSAAFGALHGGDWLAAAVAGTAYGWIAMKTGRLGEAIAAHATTNACIAALVLCGGHWHLW